RRPRRPALRAAAREGVGLTMMPSFCAGSNVAAGTLEPVLTDWQPPELYVFAVYPHRRFLSPKVKVFVASLRAAFGDGTSDPWWPARPGGAPEPGATARAL